jgi:hypothetical protein
VRATDSAMAPGSRRLIRLKKQIIFLMILCVILYFLLR